MRRSAMRPNRFEMRGGGLSGRTAQQFVNHLCEQMKAVAWGQGDPKETQGKNDKRHIITLCSEKSVDHEK